MAQTTRTGSDVPPNVFITGPAGDGMRTRYGNQPPGFGYQLGYADGVASVATDPSAPVITIVSPTPGAEPGAAGGFPLDPIAARNTPIVLDVTDTTSGVTPAGLVYIGISAMYLGGFVVESVYRRSAFQGPYVTSSFQESITNGVRLHVRRDGGWPVTKGGVLGDITFNVDPIDKAGNLT